MNCNPPGFSIHGILQARILEWAAIPSPGDLPDPGIEPGLPALQADSLLTEPPGKHTKKQRHHFANKGLNSQSYDFSCSRVQMWELGHKEGWAPKNWYFELWCWRRLLRVTWTATRSNQSVLKEINPEYSLEALMLKLKLQYFGYLLWRADSLEKTLMLGKIESKSTEWDGWMASLT